jgi:hypothetical protein
MVRWTIFDYPGGAFAAILTAMQAISNWALAVGSKTTVE